jgi:hypothetical protein
MSIISASINDISSFVLEGLTTQNWLQWFVNGIKRKPTSDFRQAEPDW